MSRQAIEAYFDAAAADYDTHKRAGWYQAHAALVLDLVGAIPPEFRVLDIGCGTGFLLGRMALRQPVIDAVGLDLSAGMLARARANWPRLRLLRADWEAAPSGPDPLAGQGGFDLVTCLNTLHYFQAPEAALRRMRRVLRPGGRLVLLDRATDGSPATMLLDLLHRHVRRDGIRFHGTADIRRLAEAAGFEDVTTAARVRRLAWHGKLISSLTVVAARNPVTGTASGAANLA